MRELRRAEKTKAETSALMESRKRPKGASRARVICSIVATDNTFTSAEEKRYSVPRVGHQPGWIGRCIHCNTKVCVTHDGFTDATVEHIQPLCDGGDPIDPRNLALACVRCNNEKGIRHDKHVGKGGRADEVIAALQQKRAERWREPPVQAQPTTVVG